MLSSLLCVGYNLTLLITYTAVVSFVCCFYILKRQVYSLSLAGLFFFYLLDTAIIFMTEVIPSFSEWYDHIFLSVPAIKTILYLGMAFFTLSTWNTWLDRKFFPAQVAALLCLGLWYLLIPMLPNSAGKIYLYYLAYQAFSIIMSVLGLRFLRGASEDWKERYSVLWRLLLLTIAWSLFIVAEDSYVIFFVDSYTEPAVSIQNRNICEDTLRLLYTVVLSRQMLKMNKLPTPSEEPQGGEGFQGTEGADSAPRAAAEVEPETSESGDRLEARIRLEAFAQSINLTERELEVFSLILEHQSTQQISETLFISIGTVKTHMHNIFQKAGVTRRYELLRQYDMFH